MDEHRLLNIGEVAARTGVAVTALRFYERKDLISAVRSDGGQRRYGRDTLRRVSFVLAAQRVGLSLRDIKDALNTLPDRRTPTARDWARLSSAWRPMLERRISELERLRDQLDSCIACGCLSLTTCKLQNPDDMFSLLGPGPRALMKDGEDWGLDR